MAVCDLAVAYSCVGSASVETGEPSPKSHSYATPPEAPFSKLTSLPPIGYASGAAPGVAGPPV